MKVVQLLGEIVILFILFSCTDNTEIYNAAISDGKVEMRYNVQQRVSDNLLLEIIELSDTRCPLGSVCNNAGNVQIGFRVFSDEGISIKTLIYNEFNNGAQNIDTIMGHTIKLIKVTPYPIKDEPLKAPENYTISVIVHQL
jgi:hypothetical protein